MPDGAIYVSASYGLTVVVLLAYTAHLALLDQRVNRRMADLSEKPENREPPVRTGSEHQEVGHVR